MRLEELKGNVRADYPSIAFSFQPLGGQLPDLFPEEAGILSPNAVHKRRSEFQAGRFAARSVLKTLGHGPVAITKGKHGEPVWPIKIQGSITHTDQLAIAAATSSEISVGIDLELATRIRPDIADAILTQKEIANLDPTFSQLGAYFSAKESTYKAIFPSIQKVIGFQDVKINFGASDNSFTAMAATAFSSGYPVGEVFASGHVYHAGEMILSIAVVGSKCGR